MGSELHRLAAANLHNLPQKTVFLEFVAPGTNFFFLRFLKDQ